MNKDNIKQLIITLDMRAAITFLAVGSIAAIINFSTFTILWKFVHINYRIAVTIAYILAVTFHFNANRIVTFKSHGHNLHRHLIKYLIMVLINYSITMFVVYIVVEILSLSPYIGVILAIGTTVSTGYLMAKFWVFT